MSHSFVAVRDLFFAKLMFMIQNEDSIEIDEGEGTPSVYPNAKVKISRDQFTLFQLKRKADDPVRKDIILDPEFQREFVWPLKQQCELIESILMGIPLPPFYFFEQNDGKQQVVDGRQRLTSVFRFMNNEFALKDLKILSSENGKKFSELSPILQGKIEDYQTYVYMIQPPTLEKIKFDIFDRVNRSGTVLNHQEMRNALHQGKSTLLLKELAESPEFQTATGGSIKQKRMKDRYIILRSLSFYMYFHKWDGFVDYEYRSDIDDFLAKSMDVINEFDDDAIVNLKTIFLSSMKNCYSTLGADAFRFSKGENEKRLPINMALFEVLMYFFAMDSNVIEKKKDEISKRLNEQKNIFLHSDFSKQVDSSTKVKDRFEQIIELQKALSV